ncbi:MAG: hypothetical protein LC733_00500, partial [Actinobacteria bacterium]|nr:hypothetical protein [Actinomycetota bacterium]
ARMQARYDEAADLYRQALAIAREIGDRLGEANALQRYGRALHALGAATAGSVLEDAARIFDVVGRPDLASAASAEASAMVGDGPASASQAT